MRHIVLSTSTQASDYTVNVNLRSIVYSNLHEKVHPIEFQFSNATVPQVSLPLLPGPITTIAPRNACALNYHKLYPCTRMKSFLQAHDTTTPAIAGVRPF